MPAQATILVVDDDSGVRSVCRSILEQEGLTVLEAASAWKARAFVDAVDLVLTDHNLGEGDTGEQLADELEAANPGLPVLLMSGSHGPERREFIGKPIAACDLAAAVVEALLVH